VHCAQCEYQLIKEIHCDLTRHQILGDTRSQKISFMS
jgi:hypothetical protein